MSRLLRGNVISKIVIELKHFVNIKYNDERQIDKVRHLTSKYSTLSYQCQRLQEIAKDRVLRLPNALHLAHDQNK